MDCVISEFCYKGIILQRNDRKITILWLFSYTSFVKFHGKKFERQNRITLFLNPCIDKVYLD